MYFNINKYLLLFLGWSIRTSYLLDCLQCTSPITRFSQTWDHSCLDGTLAPLTCHEPINASEAHPKQCVSALYRVGHRGIGGVLIYRACTAIDVIQHDCDPPASLIDFDKTEHFYCSQTCSEDGCNRHSVEEITSYATQLLKNSELLFIYLIFLYSNFDAIGFLDRIIDFKRY